MISPFWHLAAVCCIPTANPTARAREKEIYRAVAEESKKLARVTSPGRWDENKALLEIKDDREFRITALIHTDRWTNGKKL
jgi:hypothetical protein